VTSEIGTPFDVFATRMIQVAVTAVAAVSAVQSDFWWLLRAGRDIWHTGGVPLTDHYSYTASGRHWPNHEWLWEATAYALHSIGGMPLVALMVAAAVAVTLWALLRLTDATGYVVPVVLLVAVPVVSVSWTMRPQVTSLMLFALTMLLLARERYLLVPPLFLLWANLHAQVVMGGVLLTVATVIAALRWVRSRRADDRARVLRLAGTTVLAGAATLLNPLGTGLWSYVLDANGRPGQQAIAEWHNAFELNPAVLWFWAVLVTAVVASILRQDRLRGWQEQVAIGAALAMSPLAILAVRNIPFFVVAVMPLLMTVLEFETSRPTSRVRNARRVLITTTAVATAGVIAAWALAPTALGWRPVPSALAESVRQCPGHLFNGYDTGAALIWWVPEVKVFVDNRQDPYPAAVINSLFEITTSNYQTYFDRYDVDCALLSHQAPLSATLRADGWEQTYSGDDLSLWVAPRATNASE
jgi:hypothetical protein